jgi:hypothetical protein
MACDTPHSPGAILQCTLLLHEATHFVVVHYLVESIFSDLAPKLNTLRIMITLTLELFNKPNYLGSEPLTIFLGVEQYVSTDT